MGGSGATLAAGVVACLESALGVESAQAVASGYATLTAGQEAALGGCLLGPALDTSSGGVTSGVLACLTEELGAEVAQLVASAALPPSAEEEQILGNCVLKNALGLSP